MRTQLITVLILLSLCAMTVLNFLTHAIAPQGAGYVAFHETWLAGLSPSPFRYRLLAPLLIELLGNGDSLRGYALLHVLALPLWLISLYAALRGVVDATRALLGVGFVVAFLPLAFDVYYGSPWAVLEWILFTWAFICIVRLERLLHSPQSIVKPLS